MDADSIRSVAVVGAGLMGHGIAQEFALAGRAVHLHDLNDDKLMQATRRIEANFSVLEGMGLATPEESRNALDRIRTSTSLGAAVADVDMVVESIPEDLDLKQRIFQELDKHCPERTILASNTSSFMPSLLARETQRPDQVLVTHYFNPPYLLPLVEIVRGQDTADEVVSTVSDLLRSMGKQPVVLNKEAPGFIGNRLQAALVREALSIVERGIADPEDVDAVIKSGFGRRLACAGVFEILDAAGWDVGLAVASQLFPEIESSPEIPKRLREKVERGELGVKTGKGFYEWTPESTAALQARIAQGLTQIARWPQSS